MVRSWAATHYDLVLYVGSSNDLLERLLEHTEGYTSRTGRLDKQGTPIEDPDPTKFTKYFPPKRWN